MLSPMETFVLICLAVVTAVVLFWLVVYPAVLMLGAVWALLCGFIKGGRPAMTAPANSPSISD